MRFLICYIIIFLFSASTHVIAQKDNMVKARENFKGTNITNVDVLDAKIWHHQGKIEKSLKKGLEILSSNKSLTEIDSFHTYQILAYNFRTIEAHAPALEYAKKTVGLLDRADYWMAPYFSSVGEYDSAIVYMKREADYWKLSSDTLNFLKTCNNIGFTYYQHNQLDSAVRYYNKVIHFKGVADKYKVILGLATGNLGTIYFVNGDYENSLINMKIDAKLSEGRNWSSYYNAMNGIGECYFLMRKYKLSKNALLKSEKLNRKDHKAKLKTYRLLADVYNKTKENSKSAIYLRKYIALKDSVEKGEIPVEDIFKQLSDSKISGIKKDLELTKSKVNLMDTELLLAKNREKSQKLRNQIYLITLILSIVVVIISVVYFRTRQKKNLKIHQLETELISSELQNKKKDLNNVVTNLSYKRKFIDEVQDKLKNLQDQPKDQINEDIILLIREFNSYKNADKNIAVLQADIDKVNLSFFNKLGNKFPLLTENEKELCGLFLLKLSSKDIANIRNVSPNAIKKARQRIRKKLPISGSQKITTFLESV